MGRDPLGEHQRPMRTEHCEVGGGKAEPVRLSQEVTWGQELKRLSESPSFRQVSNISFLESHFSLCKVFFLFSFDTLPTCVSLPRTGARNPCPCPLSSAAEIPGRHTWEESREPPHTVPMKTRREGRAQRLGQLERFLYHRPCL